MVLPLPLPPLLPLRRVPLPSAMCPLVTAAGSARTAVTNDFHDARLVRRPGSDVSGTTR